jgi:hypothetical protein
VQRGSRGPVIAVPECTFRTADAMRDEDDLHAELMLEVIEETLKCIPDDEKPRVRQETIAMFASIFENAGVPLPGFVLLAQSRWGRP